MGKLHEERFRRIVSIDRMIGEERRGKELRSSLGIGVNYECRKGVGRNGMRVKKLVVWIWALNWFMYTISGCYGRRSLRHFSTVGKCLKCIVG